MRRRRVGRQNQRIRQIVARAAADGAKIQHAAHEDEAVQIKSVAAAEMFRETGGAKDAVAFAADVFRREPAVVPRRPEPDEFADGIQIRFVAEKLVGLFIFRRAAETGGDGINENQVAGVEDGKFIVRQGERRRG